MPDRLEIKSVLVIGSGPIVIGQACEFDYSGTQAIRALKEEGLRVVLVNSNPATIMTDPELADATYIEPLQVSTLERIIADERPDALLPTMGGQTALNLTVELAREGVLERYGTDLIGASVKAIELAEDRRAFQAAMRDIGLDTPRGGMARNEAEAAEVLKDITLPVIIRPSFTLGGRGGAVVYNREEFAPKVRWALAQSPIGEALIEEALLGWKEFELEVMRDCADQCVVVCSIENFDPLGIHTGDSITVAPAQTLTDKEYQRMRDAAFAVIRRVGVETGGSNIQFAVNPRDGRLVVIEINPRVSRSSALASKATGFPIARIAAKLALGYRLHDIPNAITLKTPACFEPALDYIVVKIPRWTFEKFPGVDQTLGSQMKSVGEVMALGRSFPEALQKALRSLEQGRMGLGADGRDVIDEMHVEPHQLGEWRDLMRRKLGVPRADNLFYVRHALKLGMDPAEISSLTGIDPWFIARIEEIIQVERAVAAARTRNSGPPDQALTPELLFRAKSAGFSDTQLAFLLNCTEEDVAALRRKWNLHPRYFAVDTCAGEFQARTPYYYSSYEAPPARIAGLATDSPLEPLDLAEEDAGESPEMSPTQGKVIILGGGPNRIGQGIEFDYCCVHAAQTLTAMGWTSIMVNCNPETVSTDFDVSDRLFFEPITGEDVLEICRTERPDGVILQFGGQTPLKLATVLEQNGYAVFGTSPDSIAAAEDRERFADLMKRLNLPHPPYGTARDPDQTAVVARQVGYPVLVRPSFVLGGRAMEIVYDEEGLERYLRESAGRVSTEHPVLIDRYIEDAFEFDVDAVSDGQDAVICGIMQHIEEAGIHSGDSACVLPPYVLDEDTERRMVDYTRRLAEALRVVGLMNVQFALRDDRLYILEVNPRASRTVPFVSKATGLNWVKVAVQCIMGRSLRRQGLTPAGSTKWPSSPRPPFSHRWAVKAVVFPFSRFEGVHPFLGPEMRSTGEVMGLGATFSEAYYKALTAAGTQLPQSGGVFFSVNDRDKPRALPIARRLHELGFQLFATHGTRAYLEANGVPSRLVFKVNESRPDVVDRMKNGEIQMLVNTPLGHRSHFDERIVGEVAFRMGLPFLTTLSAARAAVEAIAEMRRRPLSVFKLQAPPTLTPPDPPAEASAV